LRRNRTISERGQRLFPSAQRNASLLKRSICFRNRRAILSHLSFNPSRFGLSANFCGMVSHFFHENHFPRWSAEFSFWKLFGRIPGHSHATRGPPDRTTAFFPRFRSKHWVK
jgi:hypothetical protein